jgi:hypothetical protein
MEPWDLRDGEVWVDCNAAHTAFESAKTSYGKQVRQALEDKGLGPGHSSRIRGRAGKKRPKYARVQKGTVTNFAAACRADANLIMVDKATVREWMEANPPDETKPEPDKNQGGEPEPDRNPGDEPVSNKNPGGESAPDKNPVGEPSPDGEPVSEKNPGEPVPDNDPGGEPAPDKKPGGGKGADKSSPLIIAAVAILVIAALAVGAWRLIPGQSLAISQLRVFDDSKRAGQPGRRTLTALHKKKAAFYEITTADDFLLSLGFVISGYTKKPDGGINLEAVVAARVQYFLRAWSDPFCARDHYRMAETATQARG